MGDHATKSQTYSLLQGLCGLLAFILMWAGALTCNYVEFEDPVADKSLGFGLWYYRYWSVVYSSGDVFAIESCYLYPEAVEVDGAWKVARAFSIVAFILGILLLISSCFSCCVVEGSGSMTFAWEAPLYLMTSLSLGLTLIFMDSDVCKDNALIEAYDKVLENYDFPDTCSMSQGARLVISSLFFYFVAALLSFLAHKEEEQEIKEAEEEGLSMPLNAEEGIPYNE